jgi:hypothetical protein
MFVIAVSFHLTTGMAAGPQEDLYPEIDLPVYQDAYDIKNTANRKEGTKTLTYKIQTRYPAGEVLEFYDAALNAAGWKPSFEICQRHWAGPDEGAGEKGLQARQLFTSWLHPRYNLQLSLIMTYQQPGKTGQDEVIVQCRLYPR